MVSWSSFCLVNVLVVGGGRNIPTDKTIVIDDFWVGQEDMAIECYLGEIMHISHIVCENVLESWTDFFICALTERVSAHYIAKKLV